PAEKSIAIHENSENTGFSSSLPSRMLPALEKPTQNKKMTSALAMSTYHQPNVPPMLSRMARNASAAASPTSTLYHVPKVIPRTMRITDGMKTGLEVPLNMFRDFGGDFSDCWAVLDMRLRSVA